VNLHGALRAELLAAEAVDALLPIDHGQPVRHRDRLGRADRGALGAAHAERLFDLRPAGESGLGDIAHELRERAVELGREGDGPLRDGRPEVRHREGRGVAGDGQRLGLFGDEPAPVGRAERRHAVLFEPQDPGADEIELVRRERRPHEPQLARRAHGGAVALHADDGVAD